MWVGADTDQAWMRGGSYLVARRIRMLIESWDRDYLADQERVIGRIKVSGRTARPASDEFDTPDFDAKDADGEPVIAPDSHIRARQPRGRTTASRSCAGATRSPTASTRAPGRSTPGCSSSPTSTTRATQFVPLQRELGRNDLLNEYIKHTGSGVYAVPPGLSAVGDWFGKALFD